MTLEAMAAPLFQHEPRTEQEVVCLFGAMIGDLGMPLVIEQVQAGLPDCTVRRTDTNERIRIEFELYGSHFRSHGHAFDGCDMVVCWLDDAGTWPAGVLVLALAPPLPPPPRTPPDGHRCSPGSVGSLGRTRLC